MHARLFCEVGELKGKHFEIGAEAVVGRDAQCEVALDSGLVSRRHARIAWDAEAGAYLLEDLASANGTELDGIPVEEAEPLGRLHVITFGGDLEFVFQLIDGAALEPGATPAPARASRLVTERGAFELSEGEHVIGRGESCALRIEGDGVSRRHALLRVEGGRITIQDLGSSNGTFVSSQRITDEPVAIAAGTRLRFGPVRATIE